MIGRAGRLRRLGPTVRPVALSHGASRIRAATESPRPGVPGRGDVIRGARVPGRLLDAVVRRAVRRTWPCAPNASAPRMHAMHRFQASGVGRSPQWAISVPDMHGRLTGADPTPVRWPEPDPAGVNAPCVAAHRSARPQRSACVADIAVARAPRLPTAGPDRCAECARRGRVPTARAGTARIAFGQPGSPAPTARKQSEQYTGRSIRGLNGTCAWLPQREQITAKYSRAGRSSPRS